MVGWSHVPRGALAKSPSGDYVLRIGDLCRYFALPAKGLEHLGPLELSPSQWSAGRPSVPMTIIAIDVPADATAADAQRLSEAYKARLLAEAGR